MNILALDTSAKTTSVCIASDEQILSEFSVIATQTHSQTLMPTLQSAVQSCGISLKEIDLYAVSNGPGSFTGLRIGIGAIKGMAMGAQKPCIGISTLEALAQNLYGMHGIICAVMDARCNQVYTASFTMKNGVFTRITADEALSVDELGGVLRGYIEPIVLVGDGAELCYEQLKERIPNIQIAAPANRYQRASSVAACAWRHASEAVSAADLLPLYLRLPQAERERLARQQEKEAVFNG